MESYGEDGNTLGTKIIDKSDQCTGARNNYAFITNNISESRENECKLKINVGTRNNCAVATYNVLES